MISVKYITVTIDAKIFRKIFQYKTVAFISLFHSSILPKQKEKVEWEDEEEKNLNGNEEEENRECFFFLLYN